MLQFLQSMENKTILAGGSFSLSLSHLLNAKQIFAFKYLVSAPANKQTCDQVKTKQNKNIDREHKCENLNGFDMKNEKKTPTYLDCLALTLASKAMCSNLFFTYVCMQTAVCVCASARAKQILE